MLRPRQIATAMRLGKPYFYQYWKWTGSEAAKFRSIHDDTKSVFIHIPKTAGMSLHTALYQSEGGYGHAPAIAFLHRDPKRFAEYFTFAIMRDPIERFSSAFYYLKNSSHLEELPHYARDAEWGQENLAAYDTPGDMLAAIRNPLIYGKLMSWVHFRPQAWYITDPAGKLLVDYVGRLEDFDNSVAHISKQLNKPYEPQRVNVSKRASDSPFNECERAQLAQIYAEDIALYDKLFKNAPQEG